MASVKSNCGAISSVQIFDFADRFADCRELLADLTHWNSGGAEEFTKLINKTVLLNRKEGVPYVSIRAADDRKSC